MRCDKRYASELEPLHSSHFGPPFQKVYAWCMARTNIDIDEKACAAVMRRYRLKTKREAINFALRALAAEPLSAAAARKLRGSGWSGDLEAMRTDRVS